MTRYSIDQIRAMNRVSKNNSLFRVAASHLRAFTEKITPEAAAKRLYGKDHGLDFLLTRAASSPASLGTPSWAGALGHDVIYSQLIQQITVLSAAASLMTAGLKVDLTGVGSITVPGRVYAPTSAGDWIGEGQSIPARYPTIVPGPRLTPCKLGVLASFTAEMVNADSIEEFTTAAIKEATAGLLDLQMFSTNPGDATHPPGILIGATTVTASASTESYAISRDIGLLVGALASNGAGLAPVFIANPAQMAAIKFWQYTNDYPIFASVALPAGTVVAVESSSFVSGLDGVPEFEASKQATIHSEDTTPADIVSSGGVAAYPTKSYFQIDTIGLKMILRASWGMRNPKHVAIVSGVSW